MRLKLSKIFGFWGKKKVRKVSPLYAFFAESNKATREKVYRRAIIAAKKEQQDLIAKYDREFADVAK